VSVGDNDGWFAERGKAIREIRSNLLEYAQVIKDFRAAANRPDRPPEERESLLDEAAEMTAEYDQDYAEWEKLRENYEQARYLAWRVAESKAPPPAPVRPPPVCVRSRPRARRPHRRLRAIRAAVSRQGDSGDDPGESDGPALARLGRALWHALARIARRAVP
jgi:hypothetical protein